MNHVIEDPPERRPHSPWMLIAGIVLAVTVSAAVLVFLGTILLPQTPRRPFPRGIAEATLSDGTVLVLLDVTHGPSQRIELPVRDDSWLARLGLASPETETYGSHHEDDSWELWLSRYDRQTGAVRPFDRWTHCIARTTDGLRTMDDASAQRHSRTFRRAHGSSSSSSSTASRPFSDIDPGLYEHIVYHSSLPVLRLVGDAFMLEVYDADEGLVAEMNVPFPPVGSFPVWQPEALPQTKSDGDVEVTLTALSARTAARGDAGQHKLPDVHVDAEFDVRQHGQSTALWSDQRVSFVDAMGNHGSPHRCRLSRRESAWSLQLQLFREVGAPFDPAQRLTIEDVPVPARDKQSRIGRSLVYDGVSVEVLSVGGPGTVVHSLSSARTNSLYSSSGGRDVGQYSIEIDFDGPKTRATVAAERAHVLLKVSGDMPEHKIDVLLTDQNGLLCGRNRLHQLDEVRVAMFDPDELLTHLNVYVIVQRGRRVEFRVAPPQLSTAER